MARRSPLLLLLLLVTATWRTTPVQGAGVNGLSRDYYRDSCPQLEEMVRQAVVDEHLRHHFVSAPLLRLHFHDCFVQGCDGSVLLRSTPGNEAEMDAPPNMSLHGFDLIDRIKTAVEHTCPGVVSCADIVALAAREGVRIAGGPYIATQLGRRDSRASKASLAARVLPGHRMSMSDLLHNFAAANLTLLDLVTLSGAHTIGKASCMTVAHRIAPNRDPSMAGPLRELLNGQCRAPNVDGKIHVPLDSSSGSRFDNHALTMDARTRQLVDRFASDRESFFRQFRESMVRMGAAGVLTGAQGEIRRTCSAVN
ncbi:unnamed protein product [Closterium sp. Naga37s-1]|nr:unnamed protein product [Closterium sp. Naga37s-1]